MQKEATALSRLEEAAKSLVPSPVPISRYQKLIDRSKNLPRPSEVRIQTSLSDQVVNLNQLQNDESKQQQTYLYLGYGSNMCALSFLVRRKIKPLAQVNVVVPAIVLTFDLAGIPYAEPCFGNVRWRDPNPAAEHPQPVVVQEKTPIDYHKNHWHKGLVGIVYEVTAQDFAHILATEGGGAAYEDVLVDCYTLSADPNEPVPSHPQKGQKLRAHTLFSPARPNARPDPSYAQPSPRYLKLLTDGAQEHDLPTEYRDYLAQIRTYTKTTTRQRLGAFIFFTVWGPLTAFFFKGAGKIFLRPDGTYPAWYAKMVLAIMTGMWDSYDSWFKPMFGDGERTIVDGGSDPCNGKGGEQEKADEGICGEKLPLLGVRGNTGIWSEPGTSGSDEMV